MIIATINGSKWCGSMKKTYFGFLFLALLFSIILISSCQKCEKICAREEQYCVRYRDVCVEKNFWGNCVQFEQRCAEYDKRCAEHKDKCTRGF